ncbi:MAG: N-acetyltransferase [Clostridiales bacterium]|nr:N-acetyltransferase [Clostridiales bacterium]
MSESYYAHPSAQIDEGAEIGEGTRIWHWCHLMKGSKVGKNCNIGENAFIESGVTLGNNVKVKNNVALYTGLECEDNVFIGPNAVFTNVANPRSFIERKSEFKKTVIKEGATIGANATIVCGHDIGKYAFVGAGSVVTKTVPAYTMVVGNPAKWYAYVCKCGCKLNKNLVCTECGKKYIADDQEEIRPEVEEG